MSDLPPPPQAPVPSSGNPRSQKDWMGILGLVLGVIGAVAAFCFGSYGLLPGGAALVFGVLGRQAADRGEASNRGLATTAMVLGVVAVLLAISGIVLHLALGVGDGTL